MYVLQWMTLYKIYAYFQMGVCLAIENMYVTIPLIL